MGSPRFELVPFLCLTAAGFGTCLAAIGFALWFTM